jgi:hypothetical protein
MPDLAGQPPDAEVVKQLLALRYAPDVVAARSRAIYEALRAQSPRVRDGNFSVIAPADLALLFDLYDAHFFGNRLRQLLLAHGTPLFFKLSPRLTRSAGTTTRFERRPGTPGVGLASAHYEVAVSTALLFQTFKDVERTVRVNGIVCHDRIEALQRIFEHELLHLLEMLIWGRSRCAAPNFQALAWNLFAHTETKHDLVTQHERASTKFDIRVGDRVAFEFEGVRHVGVVNRITRRATVLVESARGAPFGDGKRYLKFYIPLPLLQKVPAEGPRCGLDSPTGKE